jgi:hypothetical protein
MVELSKNENQTSYSKVIQEYQHALSEKSIELSDLLLKLSTVNNSLKLAVAENEKIKKEQIKLVNTGNTIQVSDQTDSATFLFNTVDFSRSESHKLKLSVRSDCVSPINRLGVKAGIFLIIEILLN